MNDPAFYRDQQAQAQAALDQIGSGVRVLHRRPDGEAVDVTEAHRTNLKAQLEYWTSRLFGQADG